MQFQATSIAGVFVIEPERRLDDRGFFARTWCEREFAAQGLCNRFEQGSVSFNHRRGTLRGMHFQTAPYAEVKLVRCTAGAIYDVALDLRPGSPTRGRWTAHELSADNRRALYLPEGIAHGFETLRDDTEVFYQIHGEYSPDHAGGVRWNDPAFAIDWPENVTVIAERDAQYPDFQP